MKTHKKGKVFAVFALITYILLKPDFEIVENLCRMKAQTP
jgi:hypothetical protein